MKQIVECVPNFSEGRDSAKIDAVVRALEGVPGALLLDRSSDPDHNRSVITMAGAPEAVLEAAIRAVGRAAELIDLREHAGEHRELARQTSCRSFPYAVLRCTIAYHWRIEPVAQSGNDTVFLSISMKLRQFGRNAKTLRTYVGAVSKACATRCCTIRSVRRM